MQNVVSPGRRAKPKTISLREAASSEKDRRHGAEIIVLNPHKDGDTMASIFRRGDVANQSCSLPASAGETVKISLYLAGSSPL